jgi:hypothetical protein
MKRFLPLLILSASTLSATSAHAAPVPVPGAWTITGDVQGYPISEACTFTQDAQDKTKITGSCINNGKTYDTTVKLDGEKVIFIHAGEYEGQALTLTYTATYNDKGELVGTIFVDPLGYDGTFSAKKADAKTDAKA